MGQTLIALILACQVNTGSTNVKSIQTECQAKLANCVIKDYGKQVPPEIILLACLGNKKGE